jgi:hypothetical protein
MPTNEKALINYNHVVSYNNTPDNQVGTDADQDRIFGTGNLQRTVPTPTGDIAYVRKFGLAHTITDLTDITDPGVANLTWTVKTVSTAATTTTYGSRANGGAYSDGGTTGSATAIILEASVSGATTVLPTTMGITDSVVGALTINLPAESVTSTDPRTFYLARSGSSYYDSSYKYGGARHTPVLTSSAFPYMDIATAYGALAASNNDAVEILDSETYDEDLTSDNQALDSADTIVYSKSSENPIITRGVGARVTREVSQVYNNSNAVFFNSSGDDGTGDGTWQNPFRTAPTSITNRGGLHVVYGGIGAIVSDSYVTSTGVVIDDTFNFEPEYGYTPSLIGNNEGQTLDGRVNSIIDGWTVSNIASGNSTAIRLFSAVSQSSAIKNCTVTSNGEVINNDVGNDYSGDILNCVVHGGTIGINLDNFTFSGSLKKCIIYDNTIYGITGDSTTANTLSGNINNNVLYNNNVGIYLGSYNTVSGTIENNTIYNSTTYGIDMSSLATFSGTVRDLIVWGSGTFDLYRSAGAAITITNSNYGTNSGFTIGAGCIITDPEFCKITIPYELGISSNSGAYRTGTGSDDMGAKIRIIEIDAIDIVLNGLKINGQDQSFNGIFIRDTSDHTGLSIKWCSIYSFNGISVDLYDDDTNLDAIISNNLIHNSGNGIKLNYGNNSFRENIVYNNTVYGLWLNQNVHTINHCVFFNNQYGVYLDDDSGGIILKNCIFNENGLYGIFSSVVSFAITYCCITDGYTTNIDVSDDSNIFNYPLFVNTESNSENFNIKTTESGYNYNSACKNSSDSATFPDIGAYDINRDVSSNYWKKHQFTYNPRVVSFTINSKGNKKFSSGTGTQWNWSKGRKRGFDLSWKTGQYSDETDRLKVEYFNSIYQRADNEIANELVKVRFNPLPSQQIDSGTSATVSATGKTITDSAKSLVENEHSGYHAGIKFTSGSATGGITAATKKLLVTPSPAWTADQWIGYYFPYNGYYYYITDNDADELTLSDPDGTLSNASNIDWTIEKYFKITSNTGTVLTVEDDDSELVAGTYDWIIRFIECHILSPNMKYSQPRYYWQKETWKTGYKMYLEEV